MFPQERPPFLWDHFFISEEWPYKRGHCCICWRSKRLPLKFFLGPSWSWSYSSWIYNYLCNQCLSPMMLWVRISIRARCTKLCDKVGQWLVTVRWFSLGPPVAFINKTDCHDITEILLKKALSIIKQTNINSFFFSRSR